MSSKYDLSHLTQGTKQDVIGPIQDDEALFMYSIIRGMRLKRILEIGGLNGYSALNFLKAVDHTSVSDTTVYTVDFNNVPRQADNHKVIVKNAIDLTIEDVDNKPIDLIFFDCHDMIQLEIYKRLVDSGIITDETVLALHDTCLHYEPYNPTNSHMYIKEECGYVHQEVERRMVNFFKEESGYDIFNLHTTKDKHSDEFPFRHGITICKRFKVLSRV